MEKPNTLVGSLLDFSFTHFVTMRIIPILYIVAIVLAGIGSVIFAFSGFTQGAMSGIFTLIIAPIIFAFYVVMSRIWLEFVVVVFRIAENTRPRDSQNQTPIL